MDQKTKERVCADETARFMDSQFGQLDLSGSPDLNHPLPDTFELQERHGFNRVDDAGLAGINQLKELLANPPREVLEELAKQTNNPPQAPDAGLEAAWKSMASDAFLRCEIRLAANVGRIEAGKIGVGTILACPSCGHSGDIRTGSR